MGIMPDRFNSTSAPKIEVDNHHNAAVCPYCTHDGAWKLVEKARLDAVMRMLVDSGDMTPMAVRQIKVSLGIESATVEL